MVTSGRLVLPAVAGHPAAAYFTLFNRGYDAVILTSVAIAGAGKAEFHETTSTSMQALSEITIRAGGSVILAPGGKHVMVFSLQPGLTAGGTTDMSLGFSDGSKLSVPIKIEAPGGMDDMGDMGGMKM